MHDFPALLTAAEEGAARPVIHRPFRTYYKRAVTGEPIVRYAVLYFSILVPFYLMDGGWLTLLGPVLYRPVSVGPGIGRTRNGSITLECGRMIGTRSADHIRASGHASRTNRPDT